MKHISKREENIIRGIGIVLGISLIGKGILANMSIFTLTFWLLPIAIFFGAGALAARQMNFRNLGRVDTWGILFIFGAIGKFGADWINPHLAIYGQPLLSIVVGGIIFLVAFSGGRKQ